MDREKVVKDNAIFDLQSAIEIGGALVHLRKEHAKAILAMLKEQEPVETPLDAFGHPYCPKCKVLVYQTWHYCPHCGQAVKWDDA